MRIKTNIVTTMLIISICAALTAQAAPPVGSPLPVSKPAVVPAATPVAPAVSVPTVPAVPAAAPVVPAAPAVSAVVPPTVQVTAVPTSVLERFRTYSGPRTPAALSELFSAPYSAGIRQLPEVVLSNGAVPVSIAAVIPAQGNTAPNFAINGARLLSNDLIRKDEWLIVALPETGVMKATMIVLSNGAALEIPLTVAPPLPAETDLSEKGFIAFLGVAGKDAPAKPLLDLNGDGRRDYVDDYIFTANFLVSKRSGPVTPAVAEEPRATQNPNQIDQEAVQRFLDAQPAGAVAGTADKKNAGEGQGALQPSAGGWVTGSTGATTTPGVYIVTPGGPAGSGALAETTGGTTGGTPGGTTGGTPGGTTGGTPGVYTITSPSGKTLTYYGTETPSRLNLRNLGAKETTDALKNVK